MKRLMENKRRVVEKNIAPSDTRWQNNLVDSRRMFYDELLNV